MKWKGTKLEVAWEWAKAIFWWILVILLVSIDHPKVRKLFSLFMPSAMEDYWDL